MILINFEDTDVIKKKYMKKKNIYCYFLKKKIYIFFFSNFKYKKKIYIFFSVKKNYTLFLQYLLNNTFLHDIIIN